MQLEALPGSVLDHKYSIERRLGEGAMGAVFLATHLGTTRPVAVKVIVPQLAGQHEFGQRFKREAEAAGRLSHPNVVNVTDFGVTQVDGRELAYLVMEYLDGQSLADYLKEHARPPFNLLLDVMDQTGLALDASHEAGIVHRDLKPSNIWLEPNHRGGYNVKVLDFGIAKVVHPAKEKSAATDALATQLMGSAEADANTLVLADAGNPLATPSNLQTMLGTSLGTPAYMAPEQCARLEVDARADVYSLAVIAYEMLCGRLPFQAENLSELMRQQIQTTPPSPREHDRTVPEALAVVALSGLEKDPARRPATAGTFAARLRTASEGELSLLRRSKDIFHSQTSVFLPLQAACLLAVVAAAIPLRFAASWAAHSKLAPEGALLAALGCCVTLLMLFEFQLFKALCTVILKHASEQGNFQSARASALKKVLTGLGGLLGTQFLSMLDLRPSSWWANGLWPVVWAAEGCVGRPAIARSQHLCGALPSASKSLAVRQYGPALLSPLALPSFMAAVDPTGDALHFFLQGLLSGSFFGWFAFIYPLVFGIMYVNYGPAFPLLYWSALRCRNEGAEITLPAATRDRGRDSARPFRPATVIWVGIPAIMLALIAWRASGSGHGQDLESALNDGRRMDALKLIDGGLGVDHMDSGNETPLFNAVRDGDEQFAAELLKRGAHVNVRNRQGTPLLVVAAEAGRNELTRVLLDRGASVDSSDRDGRTPLMVAAMRGNARLAELLLQRGASIAPTDTYGKTAAEYAREEGYPELSQALSRKLK